MERLLLVTGLLVVVAAPLCAKDRRTFYDDAFMAGLKQKIVTQDWARAQADGIGKGLEWLLQMSDQELWDFIPPPEQMRAINVCIAHDCPVCGDEVNRRAGHYPWLTSREKPFKVECPVCHGVFPKNDFQPWNTEGLKGKPDEGPEPTDHGLGWLDKKDGRRYYFVPYYIFWQRWSRDILGSLGALSQAYVVTGNPAYGHKCALMLAKIGSMYSRFDYPTQCYHEGRFGVGGRISDYIWSTGNDTRITLAYDGIFPVLAQDAELAAFLKAHGVGDAQKTIEDMLFLMVKDVMEGKVAGNQGMHQMTMCHLAIVLDNQDAKRGPTTQDMSDWLMSGGGRLEDLLWNGFQREGIGAESAPGYSTGWGVHFYEVADLLPRLGLDIWQNPKLRKMADIGPDLVVAGKFCPSIGDTGNSTGSGPVALSASLQGRAFMHYGDAKYARILKDIGATSRSLFGDTFDEAKAMAVAAKTPPLPPLRTRDLGGYGCAILEAGSGDNRRGLSLYYGDATGAHGHADRLNLEMFAFGRSVLPDDGYPTPFTRPDFHEWRRANTFRHYCVMVDELPQLTYYRGYLNTLLGAPQVQLVDASAERAYPGRVSLYRRTSALVDLSSERSYLLDIWRVQGGGQHDWCFHGPNFPEFKTGGLVSYAGEPPRGTLAGPDVPYGTKPPVRLEKGDVPVSLQDAAGVVTGDRPYGEMGKEGFTPHVQGVVTYKVGSELTAKLPPLPPGKYRLFVQFWDHKPSASELELTVGGATIPLKITTTDRNDYTWMSQALEWPQQADSLKIKVLSSSGNYVMLNRMVLSSNLGATEPTPAPSVSSGFQGLFNVQRMKPAGEWTANWRKSEDDLNVTLHVPAGGPQEVFVCDGEPEAQPGNPRTIKYLVGRNMATGPGMLSKYVAVVEPHVGAAAVQQVTMLTAKDAPPESVGLMVKREGETDLVHSALDGAAATTWAGGSQPFAAQAEFALVTLDAEGVKRAMLANGGKVSCGKFALQAVPCPQGKVVSVDFARNELTLDAALPETQPFLDRVITFGNDLARCSYTIKSARVEGGKTIIGFGDILPIVRMDAVKALDEAASVVEAVGPLSGYGKIQNDQQQGRWLYNEDKSQGLLIESVSGTKLKLRTEGKKLTDIYQDANGDGRNQLWIMDMGPGDTFRIPSATFVTRVRPGVYQVDTMTPAEVSLPER